MTWCVHAQTCLTLCNPMDCSQPGSSVHAVLQARILEWVALLSSRESSQPRDQTHISHVSCIGRWVLYRSATWEALTPPLDYCFKKCFISPPGLVDSSFLSPFVWQNNKAILFYFTQNYVSEMHLQRGQAFSTKFNCWVNDSLCVWGPSLPTSSQEGVSVLPQLRAEQAGLSFVIWLRPWCRLSGCCLTTSLSSYPQWLRSAPHSSKHHAARLVPIPDLSAVLPSSTLLRKEQGSTFLSHVSACYLSSGTLLSRCFGCGSDGKESACNVGDLGWEDPLEKGMATHSGILAWRIPWTEEPGGLQSMGSQRVGHDWASNTFGCVTASKWESHIDDDKCSYLYKGSMWKIPIQNGKIGLTPLKTKVSS